MCFKASFGKLKITLITSEPHPVTFSFHAYLKHCSPVCFAMTPSNSIIFFGHYRKSGVTKGYYWHLPTSNSSTDPQKPGQGHNLPFNFNTLYINPSITIIHQTVVAKGNQGQVMISTETLPNLQPSYPPTESVHPTKVPHSSNTIIWSTGWFLMYQSVNNSNK